MSEDVHVSGGHMEHQPFEWICPACKKRVITWTQKALRDTIEDHEYRHKIETEQFRKDEDDKEKLKTETAFTVFEEKNYDILPLTGTDVGFLKTRGILVDEQDKPNAKRTD